MRYVKYGLVLLALLCLVWLGKPYPAQDADSRVSVSSENKSTFNILLLGLDASGVRPDSILLVHVDGGADQIRLLSLPRDSKVQYNGRTVKLNTALVLSEDVTAPVETLTGISCDYYIKMKLGVLAQVVDALGGLEYNVEQDMYYRDPSQNLYIDLKAGQQTLSGAQCEQYCRYRSYILGDLARTRHQQKLLSTLLSQKMQLRYVIKLPAVYYIIKENTDTDITVQDVTNYLPLARRMAQGEVRIDSFDCPGEFNDMKKEGISYYLVDRRKLQSLCAESFVSG